MDVSLVHPWDPWGQGIGGFDSFLDAFLRHAPSSLTFELVGLTTDPAARPVGRWLHASFGGRRARFFAAMEDAEPDRARRIPLSLRFAVACRRRRVALGGRIAQFHRFESALGIAIPAPARRVFFLHNHPGEIRSPHSDVRWHRLSALHDRLLLRQLGKASAVVAVDPRTPSWVETHLPGLRDHVIEQSTWADTAICNGADPETRECERRELRTLLGADAQAGVVLFVGRLESQKDPMLMLEAFAIAQRRRPGTWLAVAGKGRLERPIEAKALELGIAQRVRLLGAVPRERLPRVYRAADLLLCTSGFESGPLTVYESLACGTPVVSVDVGQVGKVLRGRAEIGRLVEGRAPGDIARALAQVLEWEPSPAREARCAEAVSALTPQQAFAPLLDLYRRWLAGDRPGAVPP